MVTLSSTAIVLIVFVAVLAIILVGAYLWLSRHLRGRRAKILSELDDKPELSQDRAFNRLAMARREAVLLAGQGVDVRRAQELIAESQGAFDTRQYDHAYRSAQSAHEALVNARRQGSRGTGPPLPSKGPVPPTSPTMPGVAPSPTLAPTGTPLSTTPAPPTLPKNRAEAQFQIRLLRDELAAVPRQKARAKPAVEATALQDQASAAFDSEDFATAFRLALRGRRALGGTVESLPPPTATPTSAPTPRSSANAGAAASDATRTAEVVAEGERCPDCGYPTLSGDVFCRGCGRPQAPLTCPTCGSPRGAEEPFCGRCGSRFP